MGHNTATALILGAAILLFTGSARADGPVIGVVRADLVEVGGERYEVAGLDVPRPDATCPAEIEAAKRSLAIARELLTNSVVIKRTNEVGPSGNKLATVYVGRKNYVDLLIARDVAVSSTGELRNWCEPQVAQSPAGGETKPKAHLRPIQNPTPPVATDETVPPPQSGKQVVVTPPVQTPPPPRVLNPPEEQKPVTTQSFVPAVPCPESSLPTTFKVWDVAVEPRFQQMGGFTIAGLALLGALLFARTSREYTSNLEHITNPEKRGAPTKTPEGLKKSLRKWFSQWSENANDVGLFFGKVLFFGVIAPALILSAVFLNYGWLSGGDYALVDSASRPVCNPSSGQLYEFFQYQVASALQLNEFDLLPAPEVGPRPDAALRTVPFFYRWFIVLAGTIAAFEFVWLYTAAFPKGSWIRIDKYRKRQRKLAGRATALKT